MRTYALILLAYLLLHEARTAHGQVAHQFQFIEPHASGYVFNSTTKVGDEAIYFTAPEGDGFTEPVYVPFSICDSVRDFVDITQYSGQFGIVRKLAIQRAEATVYIRTKRSSDTALIEAGSGLENISWCTGTLISRSRVITAGHCLSAKAVQKANILSALSGSSLKLQQGELHSILQVVFNYTSESLKIPGAISVSDIEGVDVVVDSHPRDYAIFRVDESVSERYQPISIAKTEITDGDILNIIQHPGSVPKVIAGGNRTRLSADRTIGYDISTKRSSSGAGVLNSAGHLVGIHNSAGCEGGGENSGMSITHARNDVE